ncbi:MAG TPA: hypothetical protein VJB13_01780 [Candidatus Nanoarchaeia archaeon]|nr:hypothetical protein [Candidatus Nanoarchaeia archaeon]
MASFLDLGILQLFSFIFPMLLVWCFVFALLQKTKVIGDSMGINSMIASAAALTILLSRTAIDLINFIIPWFAIAIIFFVLMVLLFMIMGAKDVTAYKESSIQWVLIAVGILIIVAGFGKVLGQSLLEQAAGQPSTTTVEGQEQVASSDFQQNIYSTLFHPKVLGLLVVFAIVVFAVALLSG